MPAEDVKLVDHPVPPPRPCRHRGGPLAEAEFAAPVFACAELGRCTPEHGDNAGARRLAIAVCASCPRRAAGEPPAPVARSWAVAITTAPRSADTLGRCCAALQPAGWPGATIHADGAVPVPPCAASWPIVRKSPAAGALVSWSVAAAQLAAEHPGGWHLLLQDDCELRPGLRALLERTATATAVYKLFTHDAIARAARAETELPWRERHGWRPIRPEHAAHGAQGYAFAPGVLARLLGGPWIARQRLNLEAATRGRPNNAIDNVVARFCRETEIPQLAHLPTLAQHLGEHCSTLGHDFPASSEWRDGAHCATLPGWPPAVVATMVTRQDREPLALRALDQLMRQTLPARALILTDAPARLAQLIEGRAELRGLVYRVAHAPAVPLGELRNQALALARDWTRELEGPVLAIQWDDDDHHHAERIERQAEAWRPGACVVLRRQLRADLEEPEVAPIAYERREGIEGTILHALDHSGRYPGLARAEDTAFVRTFPTRIVLDNPAQLYLRWYHGRNTWDRAHILAPGKFAKQASWTDARFVATARLAYDRPTAAERYWHHAAAIRGWSSELCVRLLVHVYQKVIGSDQAAIEWGVHHGRTLLPLAAERLGPVVAIDKWEDSPAYPGSARGPFDRNLDLVFPEGPPEHLRVLAVDSARLSAKELLDACAAANHGRPARCGFAHIDGDHQGAGFLNDLRLFLAVSAPGAVVAIDDTTNHRWPAVGAAFWQWYARHRDDLRPIALVENRLFCVRAGDDPGLAHALTETIVAFTKSHAIALRSHDCLYGLELLAR